MSQQNLRHSSLGADLKILHRFLCRWVLFITHKIEGPSQEWLVVRLPASLQLRSLHTLASITRIEASVHSSLGLYLPECIPFSRNFSLIISICGDGGKQA